MVQNVVSPNYRHEYYMTYMTNVKHCREFESYRLPNDARTQLQPALNHQNLFQYSSQLKAIIQWGGYPLRGLYLWRLVFKLSCHANRCTPHWRLGKISWPGSLLTSSFFILRYEATTQWGVPPNARASWRLNFIFHARQIGAPLTGEGYFSSFSDFSKMFQVSEVKEKRESK